MYEHRGSSHGHVLAVPTRKSEKPEVFGSNNPDAVLPLMLGSITDSTVNALHHAEEITPYLEHSLYSHLDFPYDPNREMKKIPDVLQDIKIDSKRKPKKRATGKLLKPLNADPLTFEISLSPISMDHAFDSIISHPNTPKIMQGILLKPQVKALSRKVADAETEDIKRTLKPGNEILFLAQTRLSPSAHQTRVVRRSSDDGRSRRAQKYLDQKGITETDLESCATALLNDKLITLFRDGRAQSNLEQVYTAIKHSSRKKREKFPSLHFYHALYAKYLDEVATQFAGAPATAQDMVQEMHENATLYIDVPEHMEDDRAHAALAPHIGKRLPLEQAAQLFQKLPHKTVANSPVLQLYEVMIASAGYTLYSQAESPIDKPYARGTDYVATASAWPDLVVGAVNKNSHTWGHMRAYERIFRSPHKRKLEDGEEVALLEARLRRLFNGHVLNFRSYKPGDAQILHTFLSGLALPEPESQIIVYERKSRLLHGDSDESSAPFSLLDTNEGGQLEPVHYDFHPKISLEAKNNRLLGIRDNAFAIAQLKRLYDNLWQLNELRAEHRHPMLHWRNAVSARGVVINFPAFEMGPDRQYRARVGTNYGIMIEDHERHLTASDLDQIVKETGRVISERLRASGKPVIKNATPIRLVA